MKLSYTVSRFQVLSPSEPEEDQKDSSEDRSDDSSASRHGRRSARSARSARPRPVATGAWSEDPKTVKPEREFVGDRLLIRIADEVYYTDRQNWEEEAEIDTRRLQARWQSRDMHRWEEEKRKAKLREEEKLMQERIRREAYGEAETMEMPGWLQPVTTVSLVVAFVWSRTLLGIPPRGRMPSLNSWMRRMPPGPKQLSVQKLAQPSEDGVGAAVDAVQLRPATSLSSIWEAYLFAGQFSDIPVALQLLEFPQAFLDWRRSSGLIPGMENRPVAIDPIFSRKEVPDSEDEVVRACDEMLDSYGGVLLAVPEVDATGATNAEGLLGTLALRVKWLPQGCHTREDETGESMVVRSVPFARVREAALGLEPVAYLEQFAIGETWRGSGLAQKMLREAEDLARTGTKTFFLGGKIMDCMMGLQYFPGVAKCRWRPFLTMGYVDDEEQLEAEAEKMEDETLSEGEEAVEPLPPKARVVPIILKTKSVSQFDMLMEEIERVGNFARLRIVIVHGGLGPVIPKDIVHAEVEKRYGYCPVYAFQVGVHPVALGQAHAEQIDIRRFNVFTELLEDLMDRCGRINQKNVDKRYIESLKEERPSEHDFPNALTVWLQDLFRIVSEVNSDGQICPQVDGHALVLSPALGGSDCIQSRATTTELEDLDAVRRPTSQV
eukprot:s1708_g13.t3